MRANFPSTEFLVVLYLDSDVLYRNNALHMSHTHTQVIIIKEIPRLNTVLSGRVKLLLMMMMRMMRVMMRVMMAALQAVHPFLTQQPD